MPESRDEQKVTAELSALALDALVRVFFELSWGKARSWIETGKVSVNGKIVTDGRFIPGSGSLIKLTMNAPKTRGGSALTLAPGQTLAPRALTRDQIIYSDTQIVVINKPSGISTVPYDRNEKGTLQELACRHLKQRTLEVVHRIDKDTSGLVVFARTGEAARHIGNQFRFHSVHRRYLALANGKVSTSTIRSLLVENRGDGLRGSAPATWRIASGEAQEAITHVTAIEDLGPMTLIQCQLETGRTHQIRIHLSESGHPLVGEKLYVREYRGERVEAPRTMLHAAELGLEHPVSGAKMLWKQEIPNDFRAVLQHRGAGA